MGRKRQFDLSIEGQLCPLCSHLGTVSFAIATNVCLREHARRTVNGRFGPLAPTILA